MEIQLDFQPSFYSEILAADEWSNKRLCLFFYTCETGSPVQTVYYSVKRSNNNAGSTFCFMWRSVLQLLQNEKLRRSASNLPTSSFRFVWTEPEAESNKITFFYIRCESVPYRGGRFGGSNPPSEIPKALQNRAKLNPIVKTVKKYWI